jgi:hypothetical protein
MRDKLIDKARVAAAHGAILEVHCSEAAVADRLKKDLARSNPAIVIVLDGAP